MRVPFNDMSTDDILFEVFSRLRFLADHELGKAEELLGLTKQMLPHYQVRGSGMDLDNTAAILRKAERRQRAGSAYLWAIQDIKSYLGIEVSDEEYETALKNHPTEKSQ